MTRHPGTSITTLGLAVVLAIAGVRSAEAQFPTEPPPPMPLAPLQFPAFQEAELPNGLDLVLVENRDLPIVSISLTIPTGSVNDPPGLRGLASMVAELMTKGTPSRSAEDIAAAIEGVGGSLNAGAGADFFTLSSTVLTDNVDLAFTLMSDVLLNATYPEEELELARTRALSALRLEKSDPGAIADRYFARAVYGEHPYGLRETEQSVEAITRETVVQFAHEQLKPRGALLVVAGDLSLDDARHLAQQHLGEWSGTVPARSYGSPPAPHPTEILLVHRPGSEQSNIVYGNLGLRPGADEYYAARVANKVLGGGADARLFLILREEKGWTYGSYSNIGRPYDVGTFRATAEVRTSVTDSALAELLHQLRRIRSEPISDVEMMAAKGYLTGVFPLTIQTPQQVAGQVSTEKRLGLGDDYLEHYRERIDAVDEAAARQAAYDIIRPDSAIIVVVGDGAQIYENLAAIAPVRIIDVEGNSLQPDELTPTASEVAFDQSRLGERYDSLQIVFQGNAVGSMAAALSPRGDDLVYTSRMAIGLMGLNQQSEIVMDMATLAPKSVDQVAQISGQTAETHLAIAEGRISGVAQTPGAGGAISENAVDTAFAAGTFVTGQLQALIPAMPLANGASFTLMMFDDEDGLVKPFSVTVEGTEDVTVPAGTFSTFRVGVSGAGQQLTLYVAQDAHRIVKWEILGQPVVFELVQ